MADRLRTPESQPKLVTPLRSEVVRISPTRDGSPISMVQHHFRGFSVIERLPQGATKATIPSQSSVFTDWNGAISVQGDTVHAVFLGTESTPQRSPETFTVDSVLALMLVGDAGWIGKIDFGPKGKAPVVLNGYANISTRYGELKAHIPTLEVYLRGEISMVNGIRIATVKEKDPLYKAIRGLETPEALYQAHSNEARRDVLLADLGYHIENDNPAGTPTVRVVEARVDVEQFEPVLEEPASKATESTGLRLLSEPRELFLNGKYLTLSEYAYGDSGFEVIQDEGHNGPAEVTLVDGRIVINGDRMKSVILGKKNASTREKPLTFVVSNALTIFFNEVHTVHTTGVIGSVLGNSGTLVIEEGSMVFKISEGIAVQRIAKAQVGQASADAGQGSQTRTIHTLAGI